MFRWLMIVCCSFIVSISKANCNTCSSDCQTCSNNGSVTVCTSCNDGYWLYQSSCQPCSDNCATCFNTTSCGTCKPGFYIPNAACYLPCSTDCLNGACNENTGHCIACPPKYYGYVCDLDCGLCKDDKCGLRQCIDGCKSGYWQYQDGEHFECRACMDNCSLCNTGSICEVCNDGAYLSDFSGQRNYCSPCRSGCKTCSSYHTCSACKPGHYGAACQYSCSVIIPDCFQCDWDGDTIIACNQCANGFTLQDNNCVVTPQKCPNNCESCTGDIVCEICKTGWYGALCDKSCHGVLHCVACQETDSSLVCNVCDVGYVVLDGECRKVASINGTTIQPTFSSSASTLTATKTPKSSTDAADSACNIQIPQPQNTSFQTSAFAVGLVTGLGICICTMLVIGLVWFLTRRRRLQKPAASRQNEPFYENTVTANEPNPTRVNSHGQKPENIQEMRVVTENVSESMEDNQQASVYEESEPTTTDIEQHDYTSLNVCQGEHIYKDLSLL